MQRPHWHPSACKVCKRPGSEVGRISQTGLCPEHSRERMVDNIVQLKTHRGPNFAAWRKSMAACVGGVLLDDD